MKRLVLLIMALVTGSWALAQQTSTMKFAQEQWNFGEIHEKGGKVSHRFEFTNTGSNPFVIEKVVTSCGCTTPTFTRQPILPGRKGYVEITYDPLYRPGKFRREVTVVSNDRRNQNKLIITGNVIAAERSPQETYPVDLGEGLRVTRKTVGIGYVPRGDAKAGTLEYFNASDKPITIGVIYENPRVPGFSVSLSTSMLEPATGGVMTLSFDLRNADVWGRVNQTFYLTVNGQKRPVRFTVSGIAVEDFSGLSQQELAQAAKAQFTAQYYHFGDMKAGEERFKNFTVTNVGKSPLIIRQVNPDKYMSITLKAGTTIAPGASVTFTGTLRSAGAQPGRFMGTTVILLNDPSRPMRELRLTGNIL